MTEYEEQIKVNSIIVCTDGKKRCDWCAQTNDFIPYHDNEWGIPVKDDQRLFEKLCLESFQSGLSWRTILAKRENFRTAFELFDFKRIALFGDKDISRLLADTGIVRHRGKIEAVINNAQRAIELTAEYDSLAAYFWRFEAKTDAQSPTKRVSSDESITLAKDLKKRGWKFLGPTTLYAFMQAMGMVNGHAETCIGWTVAEKAKRDFIRP